jgi:hypothetical protein
MRHADQRGRQYGDGVEQAFAGGGRVLNHGCD